MSRNNFISRQLCSQTTQCLILDIGYPMNEEDVIKLSEAILNVLSLASASRGFSRIPNIGISGINLRFQHLLKLCPLKGNYSRIDKTFSDLLKDVSVNGKLTDQEFYDYLHFAIKSIVNDYNTFDQSTSSMSDSELIITLVTKKDAYPIKHYLTSLSQSANLIKRDQIKVVQLIDGLDQECYYGEDSQISQVHSEQESIEKYFKKWLLSNSRDCEHLVLCFPDFKLKCDIHERLLDTLNVPFGQMFHLQTDIWHGKNPNHHEIDTELPIYNLKVVGRLSGIGIPEKYIFGTPVQIKPTIAGKESCEDKEQNSRDFNAVCQMLIQQDEHLLGELRSAPRGYFILSPGDGSFLVRSLSTRELTLPESNNPEYFLNNEEEQCKSRERVKSLFTTLPLSDAYEPDLVSSGLFESLRCLLKSGQSKAGQSSQTFHHLKQHSDISKWSSVKQSSMGATPKKRSKINYQKLLKQFEN